MPEDRKKKKLIPERKLPGEKNARVWMNTTRACETLLGLGTGRHGFCTPEDLNKLCARRKIRFRHRGPKHELQLFEPDVRHLAALTDIAGAFGVFKTTKYVKRLRRWLRSTPRPWN